MKGRWLDLLFGLCLSALLFTPAAAKELRLVHGIVHVHTNMSSGNHSLEELIGLAKVNGIEAIVVTDNHLLRFEYGLFPLRHLLRKRVEMPSVLKAGPEQYLKQIEEARRKHPEMIIIPGVEALSHYYWIGSLFQGNLMMYNGQKNILVVGLERPQDYQRLPVIGNPKASYPFRWQTVIYLLPGLLLVPGIWLMRITRTKTARVGTFLLTQKKAISGRAPCLYSSVSFS